MPRPGTPELVPSPLAWENYERAFDLVDIPRYTLNSLIVVAFAVPLTVLTASWAAFAMSRLPRRWAGALIVVSLVALMVPLTALLVPRFVIFRNLGLIDNPEVSCAADRPGAHGNLAFLRAALLLGFKRLPAELFEAARLEGLGPLAIWRRVAMPLVRPVTVAVAVLAFVFTWSNFLDPLIYLFDPGHVTVPLGLRALAVARPDELPAAARRLRWRRRCPSSSRSSTSSGTSCRSFAAPAGWGANAPVLTGSVRAWHVYTALISSHERGTVKRTWC